MASTPHPHAEEISPETQSLPDEEHIDSASVDDDLEKSPAEKRNATDGYAPADDEDVDTAELEELDG
jgi:hypothetical protein